MLDKLKYNNDLDNDQQMKGYYDQVFSVFDNVFKQETHFFDEEDSRWIVLSKAREKILLENTRITKYTVY